MQHSIKVEAKYEVENNESSSEIHEAKLYVLQQFLWHTVANQPISLYSPKKGFSFNFLYLRPRAGNPSTSPIQ